MKKLEFEDYVFLKPYFDSFEIQASELTFTNLFMWRNKYNFYYEICDEFLWILNVKEKNVIYFSQPIGDLRQHDRLIHSINAIRSSVLEPGRPMILKKVDDAFCTLLNTLKIDHIKEEDRPSFDYIYDFDALKSLKGNKFHKKKNHVNKFLKTYEWSYESLDQNNLFEVEEASKRWFEENIPIREDADLAFEQIAIKEALDHFQQLPFSGGIIRIDGRVEAFTLGEPINSDTLVIHIEKANQKFDGLYNMINQQFLMDQHIAYTYVNREQDLGIEGLRQTKLSYNPIKMIEKYKITLP